MRKRSGARRLMIELARDGSALTVRGDLTLLLFFPPDVAMMKNLLTSGAKLDPILTRGVKVSARERTRHDTRPRHAKL